MLIYRYEHNRSVCTSDFFNSNGESLTGHGVASTCTSSLLRITPQFGFTGSSPSRIMKHERCAVTAIQFAHWKSAGFTGKKVYDWDLVVYEIDDSKEGIDWREDNNQIVFNPEFARYVGTTTPAEIRQRARVAN
jgi:hypothetical protein